MPTAGGRASAVQLQAPARGARSDRRRRSARRRCARAFPAAPAAWRARRSRASARGAASRAGIVATSPRASSRTSSDVSNEKPARPSRLPRTRSTFHAGRASPRGLTTPCALCTRPSALTKVPEVSVNGVIGSSTSATSSTRHERGHRDDHLGAAERGERARRVGDVERGLDVQEQARLERRVGAEHLGGASSRPPRARRRRAARRRRCRRRRASRRSRRSARRSSAPGARASALSGCCAGGVAEQHRLALAARQRGGDRLRLVGRFGLRPARRRRVSRRSRRRSTPSASTQALGATAMLGPIGISQSSRRACTLITLAPFLAAWRMRCAKSGWSLRRNEPTTRTRCSSESEAIERPSQRIAPARRRRLAQARVDVVAAEAAHELGEQVQLLDAARAASPARRCSAGRARRRSASGRARRSRARRSTTTVFHSPPWRIIGTVSRSAVLSASYEKRSRSASQHSLTSSFSSGRTRTTCAPLTWTIRLAPVESCGLTPLRRESSQARAL